MSWSALGKPLTNCSPPSPTCGGVGCEIVTIGQYLRPSVAHLPVARYYHPDEFAALRQRALEMGFQHVESGPLVRSSYHAHEQADAYSAATA